MSIINLKHYGIILVVIVTTPTAQFKQISIAVLFLLLVFTTLSLKPNPKTLKP